MKRIRSGKGLGDNLYLHCIVAHLVELGARLQVWTDYPSLFPFDVEFAPFTRGQRMDIICHYVAGKANRITHQFQDCAIASGVPEAEYRARWRKTRTPLIDRVQGQSRGRPILLVNGGRWPMDRQDGYGRELLPDVAMFQATLAELRQHYFAVFIGRGERLFTLECDLDLNDQTTPAEVMDLAAWADAGVGQVGFMIPLMEMFDKPLLTIFTQRGFDSRTTWIRQITPQKFFGKDTSSYVVDEWCAERLDLELAAFCHPGVGRGTLLRQTGSAGR